MMLHPLVKISGIVGGSSILGGIIVLGMMTLLAVSPPATQRLVVWTPSPLSLSEEKLLAKAALVYDPKSNTVLFAKNGDEPLPLASLTKLMAAEAILAFQDENMLVTIKPQDLRPEGDSGLRAGETWRIGDLLILGLVSSSNDAMAAAAASVDGNIMNEMNRSASRLGLSRTYFFNPTGLDLDLEISGAYGSARDVATLTAVFLRQYPALFGTSVQSRVEFSASGRAVEATSTATPLLDIPGLIGAKTGYTDLAGGNLVAAFDVAIGRPLIAVVLGSTYEGRFEDIRTLVEAARLSAAGTVQDL